MVRAQWHPVVCAMQDVGLGYERNRWAIQLGPLLRLWGSLTPSLSSIAQLAVPKTATSSSLDEFLVSEVAFAQQLVATVASSLSSLSDLVLGSGVLTPTVQVCQLSVYREQACRPYSCSVGCNLHGGRMKLACHNAVRECPEDVCLQELGGALLTNQVPVAWSEQWPGPEEPVAYCAATAHRAASVGAWVAVTLTGSLWTSPLNMAQLFNPGQSFLPANIAELAQSCTICISMYF